MNCLEKKGQPLHFIHLMQSFQVILCAEFTSARAALGSAVLGDAGGTSALCHCGEVSTKHSVLGSRNLNRYEG